MGFFDLFKSPDINQGISRFQSVKGAVLLDVRTPRGICPGPHSQKPESALQELHKAPSAIPGVIRPCLSTASAEPEAARRFPSFRKWGIQM